MIIRVSEIPADGLFVEGAAAIASPFTDATWRLDELSLLIERDGVDVVVRGRLAARVPQTCGRCLERSVVRVAPTVQSRFVARPGRRREDVELDADDLDVDFYADDELNVATLVETEATLALPMKPLCRDDCRGLCPVCGGNRNLVDCRCRVEPPDSRLAVLKNLTFPTTEC